MIATPLPWTILLSKILSKTESCVLHNCWIECLNIGWDCVENNSARFFKIDSSYLIAMNLSISPCAWEKSDKAEV